MKNVIIIVLIVILVGGMFLYFRGEVKKKLEAERKVLGGRTCKEFVKSLTEEWKGKYIEGQSAWLKNQPEYNISFYVVDPDAVKLKVIYTVGDKEFENEQAAIDWVNEQVQISSQGSFNTGVNPLDVDWAVKYWLPEVLAGMGLDIQKPKVLECIRKVNTK